MRLLPPPPAACRPAEKEDAAGQGVQGGEQGGEVRRAALLRLRSSRPWQDRGWRPSSTAQKGEGTRGREKAATPEGEARRPRDDSRRTARWPDPSGPPGRPRPAALPANAEGGAAARGPQGSADADDYSVAEILPVKFAAQQTTKTVKIATVADTIKEEKEFFHLELYKTKTDAEEGDAHAIASGYMKDKAVLTTAADYTYAISSTYKENDNNTWVNEGKDAVFTITRTLANSGDPTATKVYISTRDGTASYGVQDYQNYFNLAVDFKKNEVTKEFKIPTFYDFV